MRTRVISAVAVAPLLLGALLWGGGETPFPGWPWALLVLFLTLTALFEFYRGCRAAGYAPLEGVGYAAGFLLLALATPIVRDPDGVVLKFALTMLVMVSLAAEALRRERAPLRNLGTLWLGIAYVGWLFPFVLRLRLAASTARQHLSWALPTHWMALIGEGAWLVLFTLVVTSSVDTGAYLVGKSIGKHKLAPTLSPGKTWEGAVGGFLGALVVGSVLGWLLRLPLGFALTAAALIGVLAQLGDLSKSAIKREIGIKDFGSLIPGHGGVLDRFDSLLFTAPTVYWLMVLWGP
jgi:phosphatidate cytidylyltransferase